jgi:oligopeptide/dipeptide ABC transporter ATP-binding protein
MSQHILEIKDLQIWFHTIDGVAKVIEHVDLVVEPHQAVGLVGETGCGKSVTAKVTLGSLPAPPAEIKRGKVIFYNEDLLLMKKKLRQQMLKQLMSYIPQDPMTSLNPVFTIGQQMVDLIKWHRCTNVGLGGLLGIRGRTQNKPSRKAAIELLNSVNIPAPDKVIDSYPIELSGGMRQRVLIAMALIGDAQFLIADEPTTALDVTIQKGILNLLEERIEERDIAILYITHNLGVARRFCARIYVMYAGNVVEVGPTFELLEDPIHPYTIGLINSVPRLTKESYTGIIGALPDYLNPPSGCRFHPRCRYAEEICKSTSPSLRKVDNHRFASCHMIEKFR